MNWLKKLLGGKNSSNMAEVVQPTTAATQAAAPIFTADHKVQESAELHAQEALRFAREAYQHELDWTDASVAHIETMLVQYHAALPNVSPDDDKVQTFARMFGSYVGEVYRRNHGATWGVISWQGEDMPGLQCDGNTNLLWPWMRAYKRIKNGPEENIWHYYQTQVLKQNQGNSQKPFNIGQRVRHERFGTGEVFAYHEEVEFPFAWIRFENGESKLINLTVGKVEAVLIP